MLLFPLAVCLAASALTFGVSVPAKPSPTWRIVYERGSDLWMMNADGSVKHRLIADASQPVLLHNRKKIAFVRRGSVFVAGIDGANIRQVTQWQSTAPDADTIHGVSWHPGGLSLAVSRVEEVALRGGTTIETATLYTVSLAANAEPKVLYDVSDQGALSHFRTTSIRHGRRTVRTLSYWHGSRQNVGITAISWLPDGKSLVYAKTRLGGTGVAELHRVTFADADKNEIASDKAVSDADGGYLPCVSPDGKWVLAWHFQHYALRLSDGVRVFYGDAGYAQAVW